MLVFFRKIMSQQHLSSFKNSNFLLTSSQAFLTTPLSRYKRPLLSCKQGNVFTFSARILSPLKTANDFCFGDMFTKLFLTACYRNFYLVETNMY